MADNTSDKLPYRLWELAFRVSGEVLSTLGWPPFRKFVEPRGARDLSTELHSLADDIGQTHLLLFQSPDAEEREDATYLSELLYPVRALVLLLYDHNLSDSERHFARLRELVASSQLQRELDYPRGIGRWLLARALLGLSLAARAKESEAARPDTFGDRRARLNDDIERFQTGAWVMYGVGGAAVLGSALWFALDRPVAEERYVPPLSVSVSPGWDAIPRMWS